MSTDVTMGAKTAQHHPAVRVLVVDDEAVKRLDPDVVLMDIHMPTINGIEATADLRNAGSRAQVIILTAFDTDAFLTDALMAGGVSFLLKDATPGLVVRAIHDVAAGQSSFSPKALTRLVGLATTQSDTAQSPEHRRVVPHTPAIEGLQSNIDTAHLVTAREWEVGHYVAQGLTDNDIAAALFLSPTTVKTHLSNLFAKLQVTNRVQLAIRVLEQNP